MEINTEDLTGEKEITLKKVVEKANSYEFGKASNRHKVYYESVEDLIKHVEALKDAGFGEEDV